MTDHPRTDARLGRQWRQTIILAWRDFAHEWRISLCLIFALAAILAPLLVLFGLKSGIVTTMTERLKADPRTLEVVIRGHGRFTPQWFSEMRDDPSVGFIIPRTRLLAATITLESTDGPVLQDLDMIPTASGDPVLPANVSPPDQLSNIVLTHTAALKLQLKAGDPVQGRLSRRIDGSAAAAHLSLRVAAVLPEATFGRDALFVSLPLLVAAEDFREGFAVPELNVTEGQPERPRERTFASARIYARGLDDVAPLAQRLRAEGLDVVTRAKDIETVKAIDRVLTFVFLVLAGIGVIGYLLSLAASTWANIDRKRRDIALLRLLGLRTGPLIAFPMTQAVLVGLGGIALSAGLYLIVSRAFNTAFAAELGREEFVCRLLWRDGVIAAGLTLVFAIIASLVGGYRASKIDPAESLREP